MFFFTNKIHYLNIFASMVVSLIIVKFLSTFKFLKFLFFFFFLISFGITVMNCCLSWAEYLTLIFYIIFQLQMDFKVCVNIWFLTWETHHDGSIPVLFVDLLLGLTDSWYPDLHILHVWKLFDFDIWFLNWWQDYFITFILFPGRRYEKKILRS